HRHPLRPPLLQSGPWPTDATDCWRLAHQSTRWCRTASFSGLQAQFIPTDTEFEGTRLDRPKRLSLGHLHLRCGLWHTTQDDFLRPEVFRLIKVAWTKN